MRRLVGGELVRTWLAGTFVLVAVFGACHSTPTFASPACYGTDCPAVAPDAGRVSVEAYEARQPFPLSPVDYEDGWELVRNGFLRDALVGRPDAPLLAPGEPVMFHQNAHRFVSICGAGWQYERVDDLHLSLSNSAEQVTVTITPEPDGVRLVDEAGRVAVIRRFTFLPLDARSLSGHYDLSSTRTELGQAFRIGHWSVELLPDAQMFLHDSDGGGAVYSGSYTLDGNVPTATLRGGEGRFQPSSGSLARRTA